MPLTADFIVSECMLLSTDGARTLEWCHRETPWRRLVKPGGSLAMERYKVYCFNHAVMPLAAERRQSGSRLRRFRYAAQACAYAYTEKSHWNRVVVTDEVTDKVVASYHAGEMDSGLPANADTDTPEEG